MTDKSKETAAGTTGATAGNPNVKSAGAANASTRPYTDPYAASVTGADTSRFESQHHSAREQADSIADEARERARRAYSWGEHAYEDSSRWARDRYSRGSEWLSETYDDAARTSKRGYRRARDEASEFIEENPLMVGALGLAAGLVIGALLPVSRREHKYLGPWRDDLRDRGYRYGRDTVERARHIAEEGYRAGYEEARRRGMTPSQMAENARNVGRAGQSAASDSASKEFGDDMGAGNDASSPLGPR